MLSQLSYASKSGAGPVNRISVSILGEHFVKLSKLSPFFGPNYKRLEDLVGWVVLEACRREFVTSRERHSRSSEGSWIGNAGTRAL